MSGPFKFYVDKFGNVSQVTVVQQNSGTQTSIVVRFSDGREISVSEFDVFNTSQAAAIAAVGRATKRPK